MAATDAILLHDSSGTLSTTGIANAAAFAPALRTALGLVAGGGGKLIVLPSSFTSGTQPNCYEWDASPVQATKQSLLVEGQGVRVRFGANTAQHGLQFNRPNSGITGFTFIEDNTAPPPALRRHVAWRQSSPSRLDGGWIDRCQMLYLSDSNSAHGGNAFVGVDNHHDSDMCRGFSMTNCTLRIGSASVGPLQAATALAANGYPTHPSLIIASHVQGLKFNNNNAFYNTAALGGANPPSYFGSIGIFEECPYSQYFFNTVRGLDLRSATDIGSMFIIRKNGPVGFGGLVPGGFEGHHDIWLGNQFEDNAVQDVFRAEGAHFSRYIGNMFGRHSVAVTGAAIRLTNQVAHLATDDNNAVIIALNDFHNFNGRAIWAEVGAGLLIGPNAWSLIQKTAKIRIEATYKQVRFSGSDQLLSWNNPDKPEFMWDFANPQVSAHQDVANPSNDQPNY